MAILADTSGMFALLDASDSRNAAARSFLASMTGSDEQLVVPNYVVVETLTLAARRFGMEAARVAHRFMSLGTTAWASPMEHAAGVAQFLESGRALSVVDCTSFAVMRSRGIDRVFAFDENFTRAGFTVLPG